MPASRTSMIKAAHPGRAGTVRWTIVHLSSVPNHAAAAGNHFSSPACLASPNLSLTLHEHESVDPVHWDFMSVPAASQGLPENLLAQDRGAQQATYEERRRERDRTANYDPNRGS